MTLFKLIVQTKAPKQLGAFLMKNGFSKKAVTDAKNNGGLILVNHKRRYTNFVLHPQDEVIFVPGKEKVNPWLQPSYQPIDIVQETNDYLAINKPAGVLSIPSRYDDNALVNRVLGYFDQQKIQGSKPHVITRLDRDTSGIVLMGKNAIAHARFSKLSKDDFVKKYHALVHGNFKADEMCGIIKQPIGSNKETVKRFIDPNGKKAVTAYQVLKQAPGISLVELRLYTGRTHQIRLHMQSLGHPLFGDPLYGIKDEFNRQALNCFYVSFPDPFRANKRVQIRVPDPPDMQQLWQKKQKA